MSKIEAINHFKLRRKRNSAECPVCYDIKELFIFDCADSEHCFCFECYKKIDKCPSCNVPKNPYYTTLFEDKTYVPSIEINISGLPPNFRNPPGFNLFLNGMLFGATLLFLLQKS